MKGSGDPTDRYFLRGRRRNTTISSNARRQPNRRTRTTRREEDEGAEGNDEGDSTMSLIEGTLSGRRRRATNEDNLRSRSRSPIQENPPGNDNDEDAGVRARAAAGEENDEGFPRGDDNATGQQEQMAILRSFASRVIPESIGTRRSSQELISEALEVALSTTQESKSSDIRDDSIGDGREENKTSEEPERKHSEEDDADSFRHEGRSCQENKD